MRNVHGQMPKLRLPIVWQTFPTARSAPVVDERLHAAGVVAANDATIDGLGDCTNFVEQTPIGLLGAARSASANAGISGGSGRT
jgi:hypothetical protein